jgi:hypothetical protein
VVTEDAKDFMPIVALRALGREQHAGVVFVSPGSFPRRRDGVGRLVLALDALLAARPDDDDLAGDVAWLKPVPGDAG